MALPLPDELLALVAAKLPLRDLRHLSLASKQLRRACKAANRAFAALTSLGEALSLAARHPSINQKRLAIRTADVLSEGRRERKRAKRGTGELGRLEACVECGQIARKARHAGNRCKNCGRIFCAGCANAGIKCIVCESVICGSKEKCSDYAGFAATPTKDDRRVLCAACVAFRAGLKKSAIPTKIH